MDCTIKSIIVDVAKSLDIDTSGSFLTTQISILNY